MAAAASRSCQAPAAALAAHPAAHPARWSCWHATRSASCGVSRPGTGCQSTLASLALLCLLSPACTLDATAHCAVKPTY